MTHMTTAEKLNMLRPKVFFQDWKIFGWPTRVLFVIIYLMLAMLPVMLAGGIALVVYMMLKGWWGVLAVTAVMCLLLTPSKSK